jgi:UDP-GlcNAc:undecaprenyl-phosphate/decaprenyl-phosphate GlcNAc-1-phosphate transferase
LPDEARLIGAFLLALSAAFAATPAAIALAGRTNFHDQPVGYKGHGRPTPYLGGAAVLGGFLLAAALVGGEFARLSPIVVSTCALWALGTLDDRVGLAAWPRLTAECVAAIVLWSTGLGWNVFPGDAADLALTVLWVVGLVNAFNLMDNMDGAAATVAAVTSVMVGLLAAIQGDIALAILALALAGACVGFLPYNLSSPARIFLGDGGSLPIGFVVAASIMALPFGVELGFEHLLVGILLAGLPVLDTALVSVSRRRAGRSLFQGGRDHLTHRLVTRLGTARTVALTLGTIQASLGAVAIGVVELGRGSAVLAWSIWFVVAVAAIALLETSSWAPDRSTPPARASPPTGAARPPARHPEHPSPVEALVIAFIAVSCGLSPFLYGFYEVGVWGPIALGMLAALLGLLVARPAAPRPGALVAAGALALFWLWALLSPGWAESADQALTDANRLLLYAALFGVLVLLLRDDRLGTIVVAAGAATIVAFGGYLIVRMLVGSAGELFLQGRLNEPLGYVNGQAGFLLVGVWPLVALAERARQPWLAGAAAAGVSALLALVLLGQTRSVLPAVALSILAMLVFVPGRARRAWVLVAAACGLAVALGPVLEVYDSTGGASRPGEGVIREAAIAILLGSLLAGVLWALLAAFGPAAVRRLDGPARARAAALAPLAILALGGVLAVAASVDDPVDSVRNEYRSFTELQADSGASTRFATGGGNRYDYWRVAWRQFQDEPIRGLGAGNYDRTYFVERHTDEDIRQAHSIELQTLGELGLIGGALLLTFLVAVGLGFARRARAARVDLRSRGLAVAAGGAFTVWLVQTSVDWMHLIPGLTGIVLCSAAVLVGPWRSERAPRSGPARIAVVAVGAVVVLLAAVLVGRAALAHRYVGEGRELLASDPVAALDKARSSLDLNDEALPAYYLEAAAWARLNEYARARGALDAAAAREPHDFVTYALLGDLATRRGEDRQALRDYRRALRLNPRSEALVAAVAEARERAGRG